MKVYTKPVSVLVGLFAFAALSGCEQQYSLSMTRANPSMNDGTPEVFTGHPQQPSQPSVPTQPSTPVVVVTPTPVKPSPAPVTPSVPTTPTTPVVVVPTQPVNPVIVVPAPKTAIASETFKAATNEIKKIDFLFVIDNSGSMSDNQRKLARGFQAFANTFYRRADLDICTMIITSDRYLGKTGQREYQRERTIPCTKPAGSEKWSPAQMHAHIDALIREFQEKVYVGTYGSGTELVGKSLVSFLYGINQWGDSTEQGRKTSFFRKDAVANISFLTDENNYFFEGYEKTEEPDNDLPYVSGIAIPEAKNGERDTRKGVKEYIEEFFASVNPGRAPTYSVTSLIELSRSTETLPGLSVNFDSLPSVVGRESTKADISGPVETYTQVYQSIADAIVLRATVFTLAHKVDGDLRVRLRRLNGETIPLTANKDFTLQVGNVLTLNPSVLPLLRGGDVIDVTYRYVLK